eukprot:scaffold87732_cov17-Tisochrysis_lutea.AAC.3
MKTPSLALRERRTAHALHRYQVAVKQVAVLHVHPNKQHGPCTNHALPCDVLALSRRAPGRRLTPLTNLLANVMWWCLPLPRASFGRAESGEDGAELCESFLDGAGSGGENSKPHEWGWCSGKWDAAGE